MIITYKWHLVVDNYYVSSAISVRELSTLNWVCCRLNEEMIETLFVVKPKVNTPHSVLPQPSQEERILDRKKSQNIAILLRALNVTVEEVCEALLEGIVSFGIKVMV